MKIALITLMKAFMNILYYPMRQRKVKNKIVYLSRQSNELSIDMKMLSDEVARISPDTKQVFRLKMISPGIMAKIKYIFSVIGDIYHLSDARIAICDTYSIPVSCLRHRKELYIIQMWHAMGAVKKFGLQSLGRKEGRDEKVSRAMNMHRNYDCVFAPSKATAGFYMEAFGTPKENIEIFTLPRIDYLLENAKEMKECFLQENPKIRQKQIVLYLPTFRENEEEIIHSLEEAFSTERNVEFVVSVHPLSKTKIEPCNPVFKGRDTFELIKIADVIITDYSACAFEASILEKPLYFYVPDYEEYSINRGLNIDLKKEMPSAVFENPQLLYESIMSGEYFTEDLKKFREKYVENTEECTEKMADYICRIISDNK